MNAKYAIESFKPQDNFVVIVLKNVEITPKHKITFLI